MNLICNGLGALTRLPVDLVPLPDDVCWFCLAKDTRHLGESFNLVDPCRECEIPVCGSCAEIDYDFVGDPGRFVCCQWTCPICLRRGA